MTRLAEELDQLEEEPKKFSPDEGEFFTERRPELEPKEFLEGFTLKTFLGALFVGVIMMPGAIYLGADDGPEPGIGRAVDDHHPDSRRWPAARSPR